MEAETNQQALDLKALSERTGDLPPMPAVAIEALQLTKDVNTSARQLQAVIARDQALSARILRIVNSAMFGLSREVSTVSHAVAVLGMESLRSILMAAAVQQVFQNGVARSQDLSAKLLADHSWGAALAARIISRRTGYENHEEAFLCGLMHDIGKPVLQKNFANPYMGIISEAYEGSTNFHEREMQLFGFSHAHVGALLSEKWNFPPQLSIGIGHHHDPISTPEHTKLACIVSLADAMMIRLEVGICKNRNLELEKQAASEFLKLNRDALEGLLVEIRASLTKMPG